jgi:YD repeat-containing protein
MVNRLNGNGKALLGTGLFLSVFVGLASQYAAANVSLKNGNFFVGYTDAKYPGGFELGVERTYNHKTPYKGIFGWGWGSDFETYCVVSADGSIVMHESGGGASNRFTPVQFKREDLEKAADSLVAVARKAGKISSTDQIAKYRARIVADAMFRNDEWERFIKAGQIQARALPEKTQLVSNRFAYQFMTKLKSGYQRNFDSGRVESFSEECRLVKVSDKNNNFIDLTYTKDGKLQKIVDSFNRKLFFTWNRFGLVEKIEGENGKKAEYKYNDNSELVSSRDFDGNTYSYKYSTDRRHNLVEIGYSDKTSQKISYYDRNLFENVKSVKDRDGTLTEYTYKIDRDKGFTSVGSSIKGSDGKVISESKYDYTLKRKPDGEEWTYKLVTAIDGDVTETIYNECCGLPLMIKRGGQETAFTYDVKGRVTRKVTPAEVTELAYDQRAGKVAKVVKTSKVDKKRSSWSEFKYDGKGNLVFAKNSDKKGVQLNYDTNGRIASMVDQSKRKILFKYNENSKPVEITDPSLGTITVAYKNSGEIQKVESTGGRKVATQVVSAFQNLLDIIRPAGVTLAF